MSLKICRYIPVALLLLALLGHLVSTLEISEDTLKTINLDKFYPTGAAFFNHKEPSKYPDLSLTRKTGTVRLARLEHEIHSIKLKKINLEGHSDENDFIQALLEYLEDYDATASSLIQGKVDVQNSVESVTENMIAVYRMVRRFRSYIQPWILERKRRKALPFHTQVVDAINPSGKVLELFINDFHLSIIPIIATQFIMDWKAEEICKGSIQGMEIGSTLKATHCLEIGVHACASGMYPIGIEWIEQAVSKAARENDTDLQLVAMDALEKAYAKHDEKWRPKNRVNFEETFYETRLNDSVNGQKDKPSRKWRKQREYSDGDVEAEAQEIEAFSQMCQGKVKQPEQVKSKLFCWLETHVHATWKIGPLKVELLSGYPDDVVLFHDVVSKSLTEDVMQYCDPRRDPDLLYLSAENPKTRISYACSIEDPALESRFDGLTERTTGLRTKGTKTNHVSAYPAGGHMNLHTDRAHDDYMTTVIFYLTAPEVGGETVLTGAQVLLKPPAGSAVLWYYTLKSGKLRKGRAHGSCPLVKGQKWINVKGLPYSKQTHLVCEIEEDARMEYLVNGRLKYASMPYGTRIQTAHVKTETGRFLFLVRALLQLFAKHQQDFTKLNKLLAFYYTAQDDMSRI